MEINEKKKQMKKITNKPLVNLYAFFFSQFKLEIM